MPFIVNVLTNITSVWLAVCPCMFLHLLYILYACLHKHGLIQKWVKKWEIPLRVSAEGGNFLKGLWNCYSKMRVAVFSHGKDVWFYKKHCAGELHLQSPDNYQSRNPISILSTGLFQHSAFGLLLPRKRHQLWEFQTLWSLALWGVGGRTCSSPLREKKWLHSCLGLFEAGFLCSCCSKSARQVWTWSVCSEASWEILGGRRGNPSHTLKGWAESSWGLVGLFFPSF